MSADQAFQHECPPCVGGFHIRCCEVFCDCGLVLFAADPEAR